MNSEAHDPGTAESAGRTGGDGDGLTTMSRVRQMAAMMSPRLIWSLADGQPVVVKQFVQFCLVLIYPGIVAGMLFSTLCYALFYVTVYPLLWLLFWPLRSWMKRNRPDEYALSQRR